MSAGTEHCILCYAVIKGSNNVQVRSRKENYDGHGHFQANIDLIKLCDILKVSVNEAENYLGGKVYLCMTCDSDISEIRKLLSQIKSIKNNLSAIMKAVKTKLCESLSTTESENQSQIHQIRRGILFDLNHILGITKPKGIYTFYNETGQSKFSFEGKNDDSDNQDGVNKPNNNTEHMAKVEKPQVKKYQLRKSASTNTKNKLSKCESTQETSKADIEDDSNNDQDLSSENDISGLDFAADTLSDDKDESDDEECISTGKLKVVNERSHLKRNHDVNSSLLTLDEKGTAEKKTRSNETGSGSKNKSNVSNDHKDSKSSDNQVKIAKKCQRSSRSVGKSNSRPVFQQRNKIIAKPKVEFVPCSFCGKAINKHAIKNHERIHTGERPHKCTVCGKGFINKKDLRVHGLIHTGERPHVCDICGKTYIQASYLTCHKKIHTGEKPHMCSTCGKCFTLNSELKRHEKIHTGEKPHKCPVCGKGFIDKGEVKVHGRIHTGERPHVCEICGKSYIQAGYLSVHKKIHTGEKSYEFSTCGKCFTLSSHLKRHAKIHTGEKNHKCEICGKCFNQTNTLKRHLRSHTGEKPYKCDFCGKLYADTPKLRRHIKNHHGNDQIMT